MILSTKGRYGLKAVFELSINYNKGPLSIKNISIKYSIPQSYLEQLFYKLRKDGLITTTRGATGGYSLSKNPKDITVADVLNSLEGQISASSCVSDNTCKNKDKCVTRVIWEKIEKSIYDVIDNITLEDMVNDYYKKQS